MRHLTHKPKTSPCADSLLLVFKQAMNGNSLRHEAFLYVKTRKPKTSACGTLRSVQTRKEIAFLLSVRASVRGIRNVECCNQCF